MISAPLPPDEAERLRALRESALLDTPPEQAWDDLTKLAAALCGTPMALVSLIDADRQWFKSRIGLEASETPRDQAFCAHAILQSGTFEVPDARADERFHDNPLVTGTPDIRFYAGAPILTDDGRAVGTVCVLDRVPRHLTEQQRDALAALARAASAHIRLHRQAVELRSARDQHARALALAHATLESISDGVLCLDPQGRLLMVNERLVAMWGIKRGEVQPGGDNPLLPAADRLLRDPQTFRQLLSSQDHDPHVERMDVVELVDGRVFERYSRPALRDGEVLLRVSCFRDVTSRRELERLKSEFVATVSHELRTPLTSIRGSLGLLEAGVVGQLPPKALQFVTVSRNNCDRLIRLIGDILDLEKLESGNLELHPHTQSVTVLLDTALSNVRAAAEAAGVKLVPSAHAEAVYGDEDRLVQVLTNLVSNAVKFSPPGSEVEVAATSQEHGRVRIEVRDRGPGIPAAQAHRLFRRFQQLEQGDARPKGGTGLGLAICKAIVEQHQGSVGASPREGGGTVFWLELPGEQHARNAAAVLLAVKDEDLARRLAQTIRAEGGTPVRASTLGAAEQAFRAAEIRAALIEAGMPGGETIEWLTRVRGKTGTPVPVALVKAGTGEFTPPLFVGAAGDGAGDSPLLRELCRAASGKPARVVIADDDVSFRQVLAEQLRRWNAEVFEAADGGEAFELAQRVSPELIVLDVAMPGLDGFDVVELLRKREGPPPSLLVYTGRELTEHDRERLRLGVTRFLTKGRTDERQLEQAVRQLVAAAAG